MLRVRATFTGFPLLFLFLSTPLQLLNALFDKLKVSEIELTELFFLSFGSGG